MDVKFTQQAAATTTTTTVAPTTTTTTTTTTVAPTTTTVVPTTTTTLGPTTTTTVGATTTTTQAPVTGVSIWPTNPTPAVVDAGADSPVELGVKFRSDVAGTITAIRFYKAAANTGPHQVSLWNTSGTRLGTATVNLGAAAGWQEVPLATPVAIAANTTYVASYFCPNGHYSGTLNYFATAVDTPPLHALASSAGNGVFAYGASSLFPTGSYSAANYWIDVKFTAGSSTTTTVAPTTTTVVPTTTTTLGPTTTTTVVPTTTTTLGPTTTTTVGATTTTTQAPVTGVSIWPTNPTPAAVDAGADSPVELGVKFRSDVTGTITAIRFYKAATNTGPHQVSLWSSSGTRLGTATVNLGAAAGWQEVALPTPVAVQANTTYVASYFCPNGHYSGTLNYFVTAVDTPPLHALQSAAGNGVFGYGATSVFPTGNYSAANYWIDVRFSAGRRPRRPWSRRPPRRWGQRRPPPWAPRPRHDDGWGQPGPDSRVGRLWQFDGSGGSAVDSSGKGNNGEFINSTLERWAIR